VAHNDANLRKSVLADEYFYIKKPGQKMTGRCLLREKSQLTQGTMIWISHDYMVKDFYFDKLAGANEIAGHFNIGFRWLRFAAGVIVHEDKCGRPGNNCSPKNLTGMH
jgi:hypothetical protein